MANATMNANVSPKLLALLDDYGRYHLNPKNKITHYLGIPVITVTLLGMLSHLVILPISGPFQLDGGVLLWIVAFLFYMSLDWKIGLPFAVVGAGLYAIGRALPMPALVVLFVLGWILQYIGHLAYEKNSPAFYKNIEHFLIGPLWIFARSVNYYR